MDTTIFRSAFAALVLPAALIATKDARASLYEEATGSDMVTTVNYHSSGSL